MQTLRIRVARRAQPALRRPSQSGSPAGGWVRKACTGASLTITLAAATLGLAAGPAAASTRLGGVNMDLACQVQYYVPTYAVVGNSSNAYSWYCHASAWTPRPNVGGINVNQACAYQYHDARAYAGLGSSANPWSWYCQR